MSQTQRTTKTSATGQPGQGGPSRSGGRMESQGTAGGSCRPASQESGFLTDGWNFRLLV